jgi:hypothetical protein
VIERMRAGIAMPLFALLSSAVLAIVVAAQTSLTCTDKVAIPVPGNAMPAMPGMDMSAMPGPVPAHAVLICPVVLVLIVASALLTVGAAILLWRDPHRTLTQRSIFQTLARLPLARTIAGVASAAGIAVVAMLWLERSAPPALPTCAMLAALLVVCALSATVITVVAGRMALALGRRLILAIVAAVANIAAAVTPPHTRLVPVVAGGHAVPLLAAGRGLRAPPLFAR